MEFVAHEFDSSTIVLKLKLKFIHRRTIYSNIQNSPLTSGNFSILYRCLIVNPESPLRTLTSLRSLRSMINWKSVLYVRKLQNSDKFKQANPNNKEKQQVQTCICYFAESSKAHSE